MDSILTSIKKVLGIEEEYEHFDVDLIMSINTVLSILTQMGIGPKNGFSITSKLETWEDFLGDKLPNLQMVKSYVEKKVKLMFDPPQSSTLVNVMNETIKELEWRIYITENPKNTFEE